VASVAPSVPLAMILQTGRIGLLSDLSGWREVYAGEVCWRLNYARAEVVDQLK
jgi:hypothetical protein